MNIYFSCSITGGRNEEAIYQALVSEMLALGHDVPTAHLSSPDVMLMETVVDSVEIFERDMAWLRGCDAVVAEVSSPSHGVGYEVAYGLNLGKPVLCLYQRGKRVSKIITGNTTPGLVRCEYSNLDEALAFLRQFLQELCRTCGEC
ncbi:MAG TPA: nucleoside 2-deoxyribosyltransferase [Anaerolineaceae bacterium]|nr:nucleoside 2-deoxyribosyltransferase [Anaerolineaceae bacterium]